jgi:acyl-CoA synthetase (AMP-forming)/AMP-acid ligase II/acyl carrier protein
MNQPTLLPDLLREWAEHEPDRIAIAVDRGASLTYDAWERLSNATARGLMAQGVRPGDRIGLYFDNTDWADFAVAYLATAKAAAIAVPLSSRFAVPELLSIVDRAGVAGMIHGIQRPRAPGWHTTIGALSQGHDEDQIRADAAPDDIVEVLYTSGTTGAPKGVACTHVHNVVPLLDGGGWPPDFWSACAGGTYVHANALSTAGGQLRLLEALGPQRMTVLALPVFDAERMCRVVADRGATVVQLVPGMAATILETGAYRRHDVSGVRVVSLGCAAFPAALIPDLTAAFPAARLVNLYELSEARHAGTAMIHDGTPSASVGQPRGRTQVRITDEDGRDVTDGTVGEIRLRWPGLPAQHYFRDHAATTAVFQDGWTRTGDAGYRDANGLLYIVDRIKDVIIKGGINIASVVVESALREYPAVVEAAVYGVAHPLHGEEVAAAVVLRAPADPDDLRAFLRDWLASYEIPTRIEVLPELPRNASGKVLKRELRARTTPATAGAAPTDRRCLGMLTAIWSAVLNRDSVRPDDDFFALGGDSLQATQVSARIGAAYGIEVPVTTIFEHCRLSDLATVVDELVRTGDRAAPIERLPRGAPAPPVRTVEESPDGIVTS